MKEFEEIKKAQINLIERDGFIYNKDSPECIIFLNDHLNCCKGCPTEIACSKLIGLMSVMLIPMMYKSKDFNDFQKVCNRVQELTNLILEAKTQDELNNVPNI